MGHTESVSRDGLIVCMCRGNEYRARDAIDAAFFRGTLAPVWKEFLQTVAATNHADELELDLDPDAIDASAEHFRYEHDLITAEETETWLAARALTLEDFSDYFARQYWRSTVDENVVPDDVELISTPAELRQTFTTDLVLSGDLDRLNTELMWRLAALAATDQGVVDSAKIKVERQYFLDRNKITEPKLSEWLRKINRHQAWLEEMIAMEAAYALACEQVVTPEARKKQLALLRMPLTQFEAEVIEVESRDAAKEALLCIREDGMGMEEVAAEARYPYRRVAFLHEEVPAELEQKFWSIAVGDVLDPLPRGDGFELYRVTKKTEPVLEDPGIKQRIDERLLARHFSALVREHVEDRLAPHVSVE
jgi:hypothetical protein